MRPVSRLLDHSGLQSLMIMAMRGLSIAAKFALTLFIAKYLGLSDLGTYGLIVGVTLLVPVAVNFGMMNNLSRTAVTATPNEITGLLRPYFKIVAALYLPALALAWIAAGWLDVHRFVPTIVLLTCFEHLNNDLFTLLNNLRRHLAANVLFFFRAAFWIVMFIGSALMWEDQRTLSWLLGYWTVGNLVALVGFIGIAWRWPWHATQPDEPIMAWLIGQLRRSWILYLNDISNTAAQYLDRFLITVFLGLELTGVYVLFWSITNALANLVRTGVIAFYRPRLVAAYRQRDPHYWDLFNSGLRQTTWSAVALALLSGGALWALLPYLNEPLAERWFAVYWLLAVGFMLRMIYEMQGSVFYSWHRDDLTLISQLFVFSTSLLSAILLMKSINFWGASVAVLLSMCIGIFARHYFFRCTEIANKI